MKCETISNRSLAALAPVFDSGDVPAIVAFLKGWQPQQVEALLTVAPVKIVKSAILCLGLNGSMRQNDALGALLQSPDRAISRLAEESLWQIWMRAGSEQGMQRLAAAIERIQHAEFSAAIRCLKALCAAEPRYAEAYHQLGIAHYFLNEFDAAAAAYHRTIRLNPHHYQAVAGLGHVYTEKRNVRRALHWYCKALQIHPYLEDVREAVELIRSTLHRRRAIG